MFSTSSQDQSIFSTSCQSQSMFLTCRFRSRRAADSSLLCGPKRQPRPSSGCAATRSLQAFVQFSLSNGFIPMSPGFSTRGTFGCGDVSLAPALRQSPSTLWRPHVHVVLPPLPCQRPWPLSPELSMHSWSTRTTPLHLSLSPPHFELLPTLQGDAHPASHTKTKSTVGSSCIPPSRCLRRRPQSAV